ncbi:hypothetical protein [uncultured Helicobacter sp.]|uniref:hypothetical protein n=1 Tax=uncultured Helicobacter sp. TaxID=175537 RepID=UPI0025F1EDF8|nr:hypothetical protein [uncultured Helicobacter sp.]
MKGVLIKKTLAVFVVCSVLGANFCLGAGVSGVKGNTLPQNVNNVSEASKLSQADMEALFASNNVNAVILSQEEMKATEGEGLTSLLFALCKKCLTSTHPPYHPTKY